MNVLLTDDAYRRCYEAGESVSPEVEHDSQLAQGGGHVRTNEVSTQYLFY